MPLDQRRGSPYLKIADRFTTEIFDSIASFMNHKNPAQAIRTLLLGFYPLSRDHPTTDFTKFTTRGSAILRASRHWSVFVLDTLHSYSAPQRISSQIAHWRALSDGVSLGLLTLRFFNFDFASGEYIAYYKLPRVELMSACVSFEVYSTREDGKTQSTPTFSTGVTGLQRCILDVKNVDYRGSVNNSPIRMLGLDTPQLVRVVIDGGRPRMYVDGGSQHPGLAGTFLPHAPRLRHLHVTGTLSPRLFRLSQLPLLEHFSFDAMVDIDILHTLADNCPELRFMRLNLSGREDISATPLFFPKLETIVLASHRLLAAVGAAEVSPRLNTILIGDNDIPEAIATRVFGRQGVCIIGPWSGARTSDMSRGVIDAFTASNIVTPGVSHQILVLGDFHISGLWSFLEGWVEEQRWPVVAGIDIRRCALTATLALCICDIAKSIVAIGGTVMFTDCREGYSTNPKGPRSGPIYDTWRTAVLVDGRKRLAERNITISVL